MEDNQQVIIEIETNYSEAVKLMAQYRAEADRFRQANADLHDVRNLTCSVKSRPATGFIATEIAEAFKPIELKTGIKIAGILGTTAIKELGMVIDLRRGIVTLKPE